MEPADGLADLVTTEYPKVWLSDMTLAPATRAQLERVLHEQRQRDLLESHGFAPLHRLLLTGPAGTGKSMTGRHWPPNCHCRSSRSESTR